MANKNKKLIISICVLVVMGLIVILVDTKIYI
jgi:hypothetical protein